jgi:hypothetical protein
MRVIYLEKAGAAAEKRHDSGEAAMARSYLNLVYCIAACPDQNTRTSAQARSSAPSGAQVVWLRRRFPRRRTVLRPDSSR